MFRIEKPEHTNKTFRLPVKLVTDLETLAQAKDISVNQLVIQCCRYALENLEDKEDKPE